MNRNFLVIYGDQSDITNEVGLQNIINGVLLKNRDVVELLILEIDSRLTKEQAEFIADIANKPAEIAKEMREGKTPYESIKEWILD